MGKAYSTWSLLAVAGCTLLAVPLAAQTAPATPTQTLSLSDAQKADLLAHDTEASVADAQAGLSGGGQSRQIHGEIGALIGSNGTRAAFGTAVIPLGDGAQAAVSFESSRYGRRH